MTWETCQVALVSDDLITISFSPEERKFERDLSELLKDCIPSTQIPFPQVLKTAQRQGLLASAWWSFDVQPLKARITSRTPDLAKRNGLS